MTEGGPKQPERQVSDKEVVEALKEWRITGSAAAKKQADDLFSIWTDQEQRAVDEDPSYEFQVARKSAFLMVEAGLFKKAIKIIILAMDKLEEQLKTPGNLEEVVKNLEQLRADFKTIEAMAGMVVDVDQVESGDVQPKIKKKKE